MDVFNFFLILISGGTSLLEKGVCGRSSVLEGAAFRGEQGSGGSSVSEGAMLRREQRFGGSSVSERAMLRREQRFGGSNLLEDSEIS